MNVKIEESWMNVLGGEFSKPYFYGAGTVRAQRIRSGALLSSRLAYFQCVQPVPVQQGKGGYHRARPVSRGRTGPRAELLGLPKARASRRHSRTYSARCTTTRERPYRRAATSRGGCARGCSCSMPRLPCAPIRPARTRAKAGNVHRRRHTGPCHAPRRNSVHAVGRVCATQGRSSTARATSCSRRPILRRCRPTGASSATIISRLPTITCAAAERLL